MAKISFTGCSRVMSTIIWNHWPLVSVHNVALLLPNYISIGVSLSTFEGYDQDRQRNFNNAGKTRLG